MSDLIAAAVGLLTFIAIFWITVATARRRWPLFIMPSSLIGFVGGVIFAFLSLIFALFKRPYTIILFIVGCVLVLIGIGGTIYLEYKEVREAWGGRRQPPQGGRPPIDFWRLIYRAISSSPLLRDSRQVQELLSRFFRI